MEKKGFMNWMQTKLAPTLNKFANFRLIRSIMQGFWYAMPIIFVGVVFQIIGNIGMITLRISNPDLYAKIDVLKNLSYGLLGVFMTIGISQANAKALKIDQGAPTIFALIMYFLLISPTFITSETGQTLFQVDFNSFGANGMTVAIIVGIIASEVCSLFQRKGLTFKIKGLPQFMQNWFSDFIPGVLLISSVWAIVFLGGFNIFDFITKIFSPLLVAADTLPALMILGVLISLLFFLGIHPGIVTAVLNPFLLASLVENITLYNSGVEPLLSNGYHLATFGTYLVFMIVGGSGATLGLNFLMLRSKSTAVRQLGKTAILPSLLNINEPIIFGCPVTYNPVLGLGSLLVQGLINPLIAYFVHTTGLVAPATTMSLVPFLPTPIIALLLNMGIIGMVMALVTWVVDTFAWLPFFKMYEKQMLEKETVK